MNVIYNFILAYWEPLAVLVGALLYIADWIATKTPNPIDNMVVRLVKYLWKLLKEKVEKK